MIKSIYNIQVEFPWVTRTLTHRGKGLGGKGKGLRNYTLGLPLSRLKYIPLVYMISKVIAVLAVPPGHMKPSCLCNVALAISCLMNQFGIVVGYRVVNMNVVRCAAYCIGIYCPD